MINPSIVFHRTQAGRDEIRQKSHGLTQSERLVLIMVDGLSPYSVLRQKLPVLTDQRFERALKTLQEKALAIELFLPVEGLEEEQIEKTDIDRFLQQDPLDPVTIIFSTDDDRLDLPEKPPVAPTALESQSAKAALSATEIREISLQHVQAPANEAALDEIHIRLADSLGEELRENQRQRQVQTSTQQKNADPSQAAAKQLHREAVDMRRFLQLHWGYWLMGIGVAFIAGFFIARLME